MKLFLGSRSFSSAALLAIVLACATDAGAQTQSPAQQKCLNGMNAALAKLAKTQSKEIAACLKAASAGTLPAGQNAEQCLAADAKGKVAKAAAKTADVVAKLCGTVPSFGFTDAATVNGAGVAETLDLEAALFGPDLSAAAITLAADKIGAGCQGQVAKAAAQLLEAALATFRACKKAGLKDGSIASAAALDACLDAVTADANGKLAKLTASLAKTVGSKCGGVTLPTAFPGACAATPDLAACVARHARCETCQMAAAADALAGRDCDLFDDAMPNGSCGVSCIDGDGDGYGAGCAAGADCDDANAAIHPDANELCNGVDDDCDAAVDDAAADVGLPCDVPPAPPLGATSACQAGSTVCTGGVLSCAGAVLPSAFLDACGVDANCDGVLSAQPDLSSDVRNCGTCGHDCLAGTVHASVACVASMCQFQGCQPGWYDLDGNQTCEYPCSFASAQEQCNGIDDDCDGQVDENVVPPSPSEVCGTSPIATAPECTAMVAVGCANGSWVCTFPTGVCSPTCGATTDTCSGVGTSGVDNDCNGFVDDDTSCQACSAIPESCNGCDDDCDGVADEGIGPVACGPTGPGEPAYCQGIRTCSPPHVVAPGTCVAGGYGACQNSPQVETCDGLDNDCDAIVDDNVASSQCEPAGTPLGLNYGPTSQCRRGNTLCVNAATICAGYVGPSAEICDGIDNDCDGAVDEGVSGVGQSCGLSTGACSPGFTACVNGAIVCQGGIAPQPEICDGIDNDCDGIVDDACIP